MQVYFSKNKSTACYTVFLNIKSSLFCYQVHSTQGIKKNGIQVLRTLGTVRIFDVGQVGGYFVVLFFQLHLSVAKL